ncbi:hypothetical protein [Paenibacillus oceani]|uniref:Glycosyl transferase family 4 n=1 Tax=Paenibacillus oceani TaxID=2772510 RepID=A0A927C776_9BACL|nr:hypothetical protein [Paenibacillus oceani]MBD2861413.1 hypothetical protein [Paenibacillus oceani]
MTGTIGWIGALAILGLFMLPPAVRFLRSHGMTVPNYEGEIIPVGTGAVLIVLYMASYGMLQLKAAWGLSGSTVSTTSAYFPAFLLVFAAGWTDDMVGKRSVKGMGGHFRSWRETRTFTTGAVKAAAIGLAALWMVADGSRTWWEACIGWAAIAMTANALNLLDVRPGRAWKGFYAGAMAVAAAEPGWSGNVWLLPAIAGGLALMPGDLRGKHMLGDCGANLLGFALGCAIADSFPLWLQTVYLLFLAAIHRTAEKDSITAWIDKHKWVRWLDRFGRA